MTRVACLMVQRDETLLLRPWLLYHGYVFGFENLFVFDDGSVDPAVLATLGEFREIGVNVETVPDGGGDFKDKDNLFAARIVAFQTAGLYDIAVTLDCDEFLCINGPSGISCNRNEIGEELARIDAGGVTCWTDNCFENQPGYFDLFRYSQRFNGISVVREFSEEVQNFRRTARHAVAAGTETSLLHVCLCFGPFADFNSKPGGQRRWRAYLKAPLDLSRLPGVGKNIKTYTSLTEDQYFHDLGGYELPMLWFRGLRRLLQSMLDIDEFRRKWETAPRPSLPESVIEIDLDRTPFVMSSYLAANPDLPRTGMNILHHFLRGGYGEGRLLSNSPGARQEVADRLALLRAKKRDGVSGYAGLALTLSKIGRSNEAEALLLGAIATFGETMTLLREHALLAEYDTDYVKASGLWRKFRDAFPNNSDGYHYGARAHRTAGLYEEGKALVLEGRARFPSHLGLAIEEAEIAVRNDDLIRATEIWDELLGKYPENRAIREGAAGAAFKIRLARLDNLQHEQVDAMDAPVIVTMSEQEKRDALQRLGVVDLQAMRKFFMKFESLGKDCEFGLVQRRFGAEPIGLFRWTSIHMPNLIKGLKRKFVDFDDPSNLVVVKVSAEYVVRDLVYATSMHTFNNINETTPERVLDQQTKRTAYLKRKLLAELEHGEKIFVHLADRQRYKEAPAQLFEAISAYGNGTLLVVYVADEPSKVGTVEIVNDRFLIGYIERMGRIGDGRWNVDFNNWLSVCAAAAAHVASIGVRENAA